MKFRQAENERATVGAHSESETKNSHTVEVDPSSLKKISVRPPLNEYLVLLWQRRFFMQADATAKAFRTPRDVWMGKVWLVVSPLIDALMYAVIFGVLVKTSRGIENFPGYVVLGVTFFQIFQKYITDGNDLIKKQQNLIKSFMFPRAALVLSQSLRLIYDTIVPLLVAMIFSLLMQWGKPLSPTILLIIPLFVLAHFFAAGLMFVVARITAFFPDSEIIFRLGQRFWFYSSGIFFSVERFVEQPHVQQIMVNNPGYQFLTAARDCVLYGQVPSMNIWFILAAWSFGTFVIGFVFFWLAEERYVTVK